MTHCNWRLQWFESFSTRCTFIFDTFFERLLFKRFYPPGMKKPFLFVCLILNFFCCQRKLKLPYSEFNLIFFSERMWTVLCRKTCFRSNLHRVPIVKTSILSSEFYANSNASSKHEKQIQILHFFSISNKTPIFFLCL